MSSGQADLLLTGLLPVLRRQLAFLVGRAGQALQHVFEIGVRYHTLAPAVFDHRRDRAGMAIRLDNWLVRCLFTRCY